MKGDWDETHDTEIPIHSTRVTGISSSSSSRQRNWISRHVIRATTQFWHSLLLRRWLYVWEILLVDGHFHASVIKTMEKHERRDLKLWVLQMYWGLFQECLLGLQARINNTGFITRDADRRRGNAPHVYGKCSVRMWYEHLLSWSSSDPQ